MWGRNIALLVTISLTLTFCGRLADAVALTGEELQSLGERPRDDAGPVNLETAISFDNEPLVEESIAETSHSELDEAIDAFPFSSMDNGTSSDILANDTLDRTTATFEKHIESPLETVNATDADTVGLTDLNPVSLDQEIPEIMEAFADLAKEILPSLSRSLLPVPPEPSPVSVDPNSEEASETPGRMEQEPVTTKHQGPQLVKEYFDSLPQAHPPSPGESVESKQPLEESSPVELMEFKFDIEPIFFQFPGEQRLFNPEISVPTFSLSTPPLSSTRSKSKSVKKDLGALPIARIHSSAEQEQPDTTKKPTPVDSIDLYEHAASPVTPTTEEGCSATADTASLAPQKLKIQEILPENPPSSAKDSEGESKKEDSRAAPVGTAAVEAKPTPFYFLTGPFIIRDGAVRPYVGKKSDGAAAMPSTYIIKAPEDMDDSNNGALLFNEAQAQLI